MKIHAFGAAKDITGSSLIDFPVEETFVKVKDLKSLLYAKYPDLTNLPSLAISVNLFYASEDTMVNKHDEVALIPPVSGG
ncbi:molybdopterin converting factor small subunit [Echinicola pacifica]|uniref:Molybdopterin synthase sulfur carrier subunit n=1 Tax=Echinicola pacifica TaxID=346377 RepID=A0A918Q1H4_9BACT|nr:MoaD/ThiS family protein [Echinicola pacifica]GGZ29083.1 molybdopterin converting factor small subunit [Echinicola pacifica]